MKIISALILMLFLLNPIRATIWPEFSIVGLCLKSNSIVEATFIEIVDKYYVFAVKEFGKEDSNYDTIRIVNFASKFSFEEDEEEYQNDRDFYERNNLVAPKSIKDYVSIENVDNIILFLEEIYSGYLRPVLSGYRLLNGGKVYNPFINYPHGKYSFRVDESISEEEFLIELKRAWIKVKDFRRIFDFDLEEEKITNYKEWLNNNIEELKIPIKLSGNRNEGWGFLGHYFKRYMHIHNCSISEIDYLEIESCSRRNGFIKK